jgi:hypothetical protein
MAVGKLLLTQQAEQSQQLVATESILLTTPLQHKLLFQMAVELLRFLLGEREEQQVELEPQEHSVMAVEVATPFLRWTLLQAIVTL